MQLIEVMKMMMRMMMRMVMGMTMIMLTMCVCVCVSKSFQFVLLTLPSSSIFFVNSQLVYQGQVLQETVVCGRCF